MIEDSTSAKRRGRVAERTWPMAYGMLAAVYVAALVVSGLVSFPPPGGDEILWLPAAVNLKAGLGAVNRITDFTRIAAPSVEGAVMNYPLFSVFLLTSLMAKATFRSVLLAASLVKAIALALMAWAWIRIARARVPLPGPGPVLALFFGLSAEFALLSWGYRPEIAVAFLLSLGLVSWSFGWCGGGVSGVLLGLVAGSNPMCGVILAAILVLLASRLGGAQALRQLLVTAILSLVTFGVVLWLGWGVEETLVHTARSASATQVYTDFSLARFVAMSFLQKPALLLGVGVYGSLLAVSALPWTRRVRTGWLYAIGLACLWGAVISGSVLRSEQPYNAAAFLPIGVGLLIHLSASSSRAGFLAAAPLAFSAAGAPLAVGALVLHLAAGLRFGAARETFQKVRERLEPVGAQRYAVTTALWGFSNGPEDARSFFVLDQFRADHRAELPGSVLVLQQLFGDALIPGRIPPLAIVDPGLGIDHTLVLDRFDRHLVGGRGPGTGATIPGWGFAVYAPRRLACASGLVGCPGSTP